MSNLFKCVCYSICEHLSIVSLLIKKQLILEVELPKDKYKKTNIICSFVCVLAILAVAIKTNNNNSHVYTKQLHR